MEANIFNGKAVSTPRGKFIHAMCDYCLAPSLDSSRYMILSPNLAVSEVDSDMPVEYMQLN